MIELKSIRTINNLSLDQKLFGFLLKLFGTYNFTTEKIKFYQYEVILSNTASDLLITNVCLLKNKNLVMSLNIEKTDDDKTLLFTLSDEKKFNFINFCILYKYFYQYILQNTTYDNLALKTNRYNSYTFTKFFGFSVIGQVKNNFFLQFNTKEGLQNIWDTYYGVSTEENLYNFLLPIDAGGFAPHNIKLTKPNQKTDTYLFKKTEKKFHLGTKPAGEIKIGYKLFNVFVRDISEKGISLILGDNNAEEKAEVDLTSTDIQLNQTYAIWVSDENIKMTWTNLSIQILWVHENTFGCKIIEDSNTWKKFIDTLSIKENERLTFTENRVD